MKIDEEKQYGLHKLEKNTATNENKKIYSYHNSLLINLDFETPTEEQRPKKIITKKGYKRYRTIIEENVCKLLKTKDPGVEITIFSGVRHFCKNFLNFIFKNIFCNHNLGGCGKLIFTSLLVHV